MFADFAACLPSPPHSCPQLIKHTLCGSDPPLRNRVLLFDVGVGPKDGKCYRVARGPDPHAITTHCGNKTRITKLLNITVGHGRYEFLGMQRFYRLDDIVKEDVKVLSVDVGGAFERYAIQGMSRLFGNASLNVWFAVVGYHGQHSVLDYLARHGYKLSPDGFFGPWRTPEELKALPPGDQDKVEYVYAAKASMFEGTGLGLRLRRWWNAEWRPPRWLEALRGDFS